MRGADRDSQRVYTCLGGEIYHLLGLGIVGNFRGNLVLYTCQNAQLAFNGNVELMSVLYNFLSQGNILVVRKRRTVNHH